MPGVGENTKCKMGANKGSERNQIHRKNPTAVCQSLLSLLLEELFLVSLYSFSSKPGRLKEKEKLEMSSNGMSEGAVKEVPLKPEASAEMLFSALVLDSCLPDNFCQSSFTEDKLDFDSKGV